LRQLNPIAEKVLSSSHYTYDHTAQHIITDKMAAEPPPTLLSFDAPLLVEGPAAVAAAAAAAAKKVAMRGAASQLEDIITSMLPPRFVREN
jgi:hypothetical protein